MGRPFEVRREAVTSYSCRQMYALVSDVDSYSQFLPWCSASGVEKQSGNRVRARIAYRWKGIEGSFATCNTHTPDSRIVMELSEGPFKELQGQWTFTPLDHHACKLRFILRFSFSNRLYELAAAPVFKHCTHSLLDAFLKRAQFLY